MPWVSQYLVMKRVSIEPNFHSLYSNFLDTLKNPEFNKMVLNETYRNIKVRFSSCFLFITVLNLEILDCTSTFIKNLVTQTCTVYLESNSPILILFSSFRACFKF